MPAVRVNAAGAGTTASALIAGGRNPNLTNTSLEWNDPVLSTKTADTD